MDLCTQQQQTEQRSTIEILDIGVDCLEHVFANYDLEDLLRVADVCQKFKEAANYVFIWKYSKKKIGIEFDGFRYAGNPNYVIRNDQLLITNYETAIKLLRSFGRNISDIKLDYGYTYRHYEIFRRCYVNVIRYINHYCADSLKRINILPIQTEFDELCRKPFSEAETIVLCVADLDIYSLKTLFPKMQSLTLTWHNIEHKPTTKAEHYPHLKRLEIYYRGSWRSSEFGSFLFNILQSNQQIQSLELCAHSRILSEMKTIHLPNVRDFTIEDFHFDIIHPNNIPFKFDKVEVVKFKSLNGRCFNTYHNFIWQNTSIQKLIFDRVMTDAYADLENGVLSRSQSLKSLTSLKEICMETRNNFSIDYVIKYVKQFDTLKYFSFFCSSSKRSIDECCGNDWEIVYLKTPEQLRFYPRNFPFVKLIRKT